mmetsp:Transcript_52997/g.124157  ORF Transcript_52997/g.124157 Transcript_52997/m.124157 type:complete len:663 (-) Transcript_52997:144-2132(-)
MGAAIAGALTGEDLCTSACGSRTYPPPFLPPNKSLSLYAFDASKQDEFQFLKVSASSQGDGYGLDALKSPITVDEDFRGFLLEPQAPKRGPATGYTLHEYKLHGSTCDMVVSGRTFVQCAGKAEWMSRSMQSMGGACAFAVYTRGYPVIERLQTGTFTHFGQVVTSAICFAVRISASASNIYLCPQISLALQNGEQVVLVEDRLGPFRLPEAFYSDFTIVDNGRDVQMDIIFRGKDPESGHGIRTLRTCLQEYTTYNSHLAIAKLSCGYCNIGAVSSEAAVHAQNLVISEESGQDKTTTETLPLNVWQQDLQAHVVYEGRQARGKYDCLSQTRGHPQLQRLTVEQLYNARTDRPAKDEWWCNVKFDTDSDDAGGLNNNNHHCTMHSGEIWMSPVLDSRHVYFQCSATLAQALTLCIIFRFSCPIEYLRLITERSSHALMHMHIPTNGIVMGVERDPRHPALLRMFIEHRNRIVEDMVICECQDDESLRSIRVYQEVYDGGTWIGYRVTVVRPNGSRQSAIQQASTDSFIDPSHSDPQDMPPFEEPSIRFPITPSLARHDLSPSSRVFLYSSSTHIARVNGAGGMHSDSNSAGDVTPRGNNSVAESMGTMSEDWHSAAGGASDNEGEPRVDEKLGSVWTHPLVDSCVLATNMEVQPFADLPGM